MAEDESKAKKKEEKRNQTCKSLYKVSKGILWIQLGISAVLGWMIKDLLPEQDWHTVLVVLAVLWFVGALVYGGLKKKLVMVVLWPLSILFCAVLGYGCYVVGHGLYTLDQVTDVTYQSHVMSLIVPVDSEYEAISDLNEKTIGMITAAGDDYSGRAFDQIQKEKQVTWNSKVYESMAVVYQAFMEQKIDAMLVNEAYSKMVEDIIPEYASHIRVIYQMEIQEEILLTEEQEPDKNLEDSIYDGLEVYEEEEEDIIEAAPTPTPTPEPEKEEPTQETTSTPEPPKENQTQGNKKEKPVVTKDTFHVFVSGIDTYGSVSTVSRSDVNMIMTVNPTTKQILLTSIPRDYYVVLPSKGAYDKLTHAGIYGVNESVRTMENLFGIQIDYYIKVNFTSVINIVDAVGGITFHNPTAFSSGSLDFQKGQITLNGNQALRYVRERHSFASGDNARVKNQQRVLAALIQKAISPSIIKNYSNVLSAVSGSFVTNMSSGEIQSLIQMQLDDMSSWNIDQISVTGYNARSTNCYSMKGYSLYVMKPNYNSVNSAANKIKSMY